MINRGNHPELSCSGGQRSVVHLQADLNRVVTWAGNNGRQWAFTSGNAAAYYAEFYNDLKHLDKVNWDAVNAHYWSEVREEKQAEFLLFESLPWHLVEEIGVTDNPMSQAVTKTLASAAHRPAVNIRGEWYY